MDTTYLTYAQTAEYIQNLLTEQPTVASPALIFFKTECEKIGQHIHHTSIADPGDFFKQTMDHLPPAGRRALAPAIPYLQNIIH